MHDHELVVLGHDNVLLDVVGVHGVGHGLGFEGMFGQVAAGAAGGGNGGAIVGGEGINGAGKAHEHHEAGGNEKLVHGNISYVTGPQDAGSF